MNCIFQITKKNLGLNNFYFVSLTSTYLRQKFDKNKSKFYFCNQISYSKGNYYFILDKSNKMTSNRNPKSLREFIEKSKLDIDEINLSNRNEFDETLKNLKNISQEEKSELGMLKSRVEEQSRLIMILKQRGDDYIRKNATLEKINQELLEQKQELQAEVEQLNQKYKSLLDKFDYLANNHQELIKIKDEYKTKNTDITLKYVQLLDKMKNLPDEEVFELEKRALNEKITRLDHLCKDYEQKLENLKEENENFVSKLKEEILKSEQKDREIYDLIQNKSEIDQKNKGLYFIS